MAMAELALKWKRDGSGRSIWKIVIFISSLLILSENILSSLSSIICMHIFIRTHIYIYIRHEHKDDSLSLPSHPPSLSLSVLYKHTHTPLPHSAVEVIWYSYFSLHQRPPAEFGLHVAFGQKMCFI